MRQRDTSRAGLTGSGRNRGYRAAERDFRSGGGWLLHVVMLGGLAGAGSLMATPEGRAAVNARVKPVAVSMGIVRAREPQAGDYWPGCNAARAAGTAPIYSGEPGYREGMDGDGDGIACEPHY